MSIDHHQIALKARFWDTWSMEESKAIAEAYLDLYRRLEAAPQPTEPAADVPPPQQMIEGRDYYQTGPYRVPMSPAITQGPASTEPAAPGGIQPGSKREPVPPSEPAAAGPSAFYSEPEPCRGCGKPLLVENAWMFDGCPCNTPAGVNDDNLYRWKLLGELQQRQSRALESKQAKIDALMLEYCPEEMTKEQVDNWARHQRPASTEEAQAIEAAAGPAHTDHPLRHFDRTCPACQAGPGPTPKPLPDCMMPDGAEPCIGYQHIERELQQAQADLVEVDAANVRLARELQQARSTPSASGAVAKMNEAIGRGLNHVFFEDGLSADLHEMSNAEAYREGWRDAWLEMADDLAAIR